MMVLPSPSVLLCDSFSYPPGAIVSNSASLWSTYSGLAGRMQVVAGELRLTEDDTEDVLAQPIGSPFAPSNNITLYASFNVIFLEMPEASGAYFALFRELGTTYRARVFAATLRSEQGNFGLGIANTAGSITNVAFAATTLTLNTRYLVVMRYDVTTGRSAL